MDRLAAGEGQLDGAGRGGHAGNGRCTESSGPGGRRQSTGPGTDVGAGGRDHLAGEGLNKSLVLAGLRLADKVHSAGLEGVEHPQVQRGHQKDGQRDGGEQLL